MQSAEIKDVIKTLLEIDNNKELVNEVIENSINKEEVRNLAGFYLYKAVENRLKFLKNKSKVISTLKDFVEDISIVARDFYTLWHLYGYQRINKLLYSPAFLFTTFYDKEFFINLGLKAVLEQSYKFPYTFELTGVLLFSEKVLKEAEDLENWQKDLILNESYYLTDRNFYDFYEEYLYYPAIALSINKELFFIVKYKFPCNIYISNFKVKNDNENRYTYRWVKNAKEMGIEWKSYFYFDFIGKEPSVFKLTDEREEEFVKNIANIIINTLKQV